MQRTVGVVESGDLLAALALFDKLTKRVDLGVPREAIVLG